MSNATKNDLHEDDLPLYEDAKIFSKLWDAGKQAQEDYETQKANLLAQFNAEWDPTLKKIAHIEEERRTLKSRIQEFISIQTLTRKRKSFMAGTITTRMLKRAGDYDVEELKAWAVKKFQDVWKLPDDKNKQKQIILHLWATRPDLLEFDEKAALSHALETASNGYRIHQDAPVEISYECTNMSDATLDKLLGTALIEKEFDEKEDE